MAIRRSAAGEIDRLIADLSAPDPVAREAAAARLSVIGARAVPHLIGALATAPSAAGRSAVLTILEATRDRRGLDAAIGLLARRDTEPNVALACISLLAAGLESGHGAEALDALTSVAVDQARADGPRLAAMDALDRMPGKMLAPLHKRLAGDASAVVRARVSAAPAERAAHPDPVAALEEAASGLPADPGGVRALISAAGSAVPLPTLHRLVTSIRAREARAPSDLDRAEWLDVRAAVHEALASRGSRVALYDLRETVESAPGSLPAPFLAAIAAIGDASCLEPLAAALARAAAARKVKAAWKASLLAAARTIVHRERLTRRHAAVRRVIDRWPAVAADMLARPGQ